MTSPEDQRWQSIERFLGREALLLDGKDWDGWLKLYREDAEYWVPAWGDDDLPTTNPQTEISLIYYANRGGLEDRVYRIRTERSSASVPAMRTSHQFTLLDVTDHNGTVKAKTTWTTNSFREPRVLTYFGSAEYDLVADGDSWQIAAKKTIVLNDIPHVVLDVYNI